MRAAQASAMSELSPPGRRVTAEARRSQWSWRRIHAIAAPAAALWPSMVRAPPSKVIIAGVSRP
eukprot:4840245-Lingulodinium_polyedra.AAC.1